MNKPQIDIIPSYKIDYQKWNDCIQKSNNSLIYACSYYLDNMCINWSAIVLHDYEVVMPIPWKNKFGIRYCYDVPFIQQLGIFSTIKENCEKLFLEKLFDFCKYGDYHFNYANKTEGESKTNFIIDLSSSYDKIAGNYKNDLINNLKKAAKEDLIYKTAIDYKTAIEFYKQTYASRFLKTTEEDYNKFEKLCTHLNKNNQVIVRSVINSSNELLSIVLLLKDDKRIYNIMNTTLDKGRKTEANHFLLDSIIKEFASSKLIFDFEGSDVPGIKSFYEKFGAINQPYYSFHFNKLPAPIRWIKK